MKKKLECRMFNDNAELYDFVNLVGKVDTKFKLEDGKYLAVTNRILEIAKEARDAGKNPNALPYLERIIPILKEELSDYLEFKVYDDATDGWVVA